MRLSESIECFPSLQYELFATWWQHINTLAFLSFIQHSELVQIKSVELRSPVVSAAPGE